MNKAFLVLIGVLLIGFLVTSLTSSPPEEEVVSAERIIVSAPLPESSILSPLHITGVANAEWFAEGPVQIVLTNWDGLIIAEGKAEKGSADPQGLFTFETDLFFEKPEFNNRGTLIIQKANPTRDPAKAEAREMTVFFE
jgi:hypothetical protein